VGVRVSSHLGDLTRDLQSASKRMPRKISTAVYATARDGARVARGFAKGTAGAHGKHYPKAITAERISRFIAEYGNDAALPQGGMSFEWGSRNQKPHLDIARSHDIAKITFRKKTEEALEEGLPW
jgi:hypothetical protein